ncbi:hypothetical protein Scep_030366 [Stephania cephalantha]|uniref:Uncharacterized protein n=1 Tax=Stephania cephalantha TaxID=152367 RepID=A0AAP0HIK4_9MAGN
MTGSPHFTFSRSHSWIGSDENASKQSLLKKFLQIKKDMGHSRMMCEMDSTSPPQRPHPLCSNM